MDRCVVAGDPLDRRPNVLAGTGDVPQQPEGRCLMIATGLRKALPGKRLGPAGQHGATRLSGEYGTVSADCFWVLDSHLRNLLSYTQLERVPCSFR